MMLALLWQGFVSLRLYLTFDLPVDLQHRKYVSAQGINGRESSRVRKLRHRLDTFVSHGFGGDGNAIIGPI